MKEIMKKIGIALLVTLFAVAFFFIAAGNYTLVIFHFIELPEWLFDILAYGVGTLMGLIAIILWVGCFSKE